MRIKTLPLIYLAGVFMSAGVNAQIAGGGGYSLDRSLMSASAQTVVGGAYSLSGSIGEGFSPIAGERTNLKAPLVRIYDGFSWPLQADPSQDYPMWLENGEVQIMIPAGAVPQPYEVTIELEPAVNPIAVDPVGLWDATLQLATQLGTNADGLLKIIEMRVLLNDNTLLAQNLSRAASCAVSYISRPNGGPITIQNFDDGPKRWTQLLALDGIKATATAVFSQAQLGVFAIFQQGSAEVAAAYAFPVPWRPNAGNPAQYGTPQGGITFANVPSVGAIRIFDMAGELIRELEIPLGFSQVPWDGKTSSGRDAASGVYIWDIESGGNRKLGKLMVIR